MAKEARRATKKKAFKNIASGVAHVNSCLLYTSDAADE